MHRFLSLLFFTSLFLGACNPTVVLLKPEAQPSPTTGVVTLPTPLARTPYPTPTKTQDLGANPNALRGIEIRAWDGWNGSSASLLEQMASEFNLSNKWGVKVKFAHQRNLNLLGTEVEKTLGTADQPDLVIALPEQILGWKDQIVDLTPYAAQAEYGLDLADLPVAFGNQSKLGEAHYGVPAARSAWFIFYNISFARDLGFSTAPQTPEEFRKQACAANGFWKQDADLTNDGFGGLALDVAANWQTPFSWVTMEGGDVFPKGKYHFNTPENINALDFVSKLRQDTCAWLPDASTNFDFLASRQALFITGSLDEITNQSVVFSSASSPDQWTLLPFPGQKPGIVAFGPDYAVLKSNPANQMAAWLFISWMLEEKNQARWSLGTGLLPVTNSAIKLVRDGKALNPQWAAALDLIPQARIYPQSADWRVANKVFADGFIAYFRSYPNFSLENALEVIDVTTQDLLKQ